MSKQYDSYLYQHRSNVILGFMWMKKNMPKLIEEAPDLEYNIMFRHDKSKEEMDEYAPYDKYFYGINKSYQVVQDFRKAWLLHIHRNPHHWQHWILINDDPKEGEIILDMPFSYIVEMICDWWSFSWNNDNLFEIFDWYDNHKDYMKLSPSTRMTVEKILDEMLNHLNTNYDFKKSEQEESL